jgi:hypothetical protein
MSTFGGGPKTNVLRNRAIVLGAMGYSSVEIDSTESKPFVSEALKVLRPF